MPLDYVDLTKNRYDQSTYFGRWTYFMQITNPLTLLKTDKQLADAVALVAEAKAGKKVDVEAAWKAQILCASSIHPDTQLALPRPFRMSAFMPMNLLVLFGMQHPSQASPMCSAFWQLMNQTYNVVMNYANRNASSEMSMTEVLQCYAMAVVTSCGISVAGMKLLANMTTLPAKVQFIAGVLVPYVAVSMAGVANVGMMRKKEVDAGIFVQDENGDTLPTRSRNAGFHAVKQVAISRCFIPLPLMTIPPVVMALLDNAGVFKKRAAWRNPTSLAAISFCLLFAAPSAIALFPQVASLPIERMEPEFQGLKDRNGNPIKTVYFNKGL